MRMLFLFGVVAIVVIFFVLVACSGNTDWRGEL